MIIRLSTKTKHQLHVNKLEGLKHPENKNFLEEWNIDVVIINRKKYFMITENKTLFTIINHSKGINSIILFEEYFAELLSGIFNELIDTSIKFKLDDQKFIYTSTENNNVRRAQIDHLYHAKHLVDDGKNTFDINRFPIKSINYQFPVDFFIDEVSKILSIHGGYFMKT